MQLVFTNIYNYLAIAYQSRSQAYLDLCKIIPLTGIELWLGDCLCVRWRYTRGARRAIWTVITLSMYKRSCIVIC